MSDLVQVEQLRKEFGGLVAVDDVDFTIPQNAIVSLIGPNGAGKTTFFNMLTGVYKPTSGTGRSEGRGRDRQAAARDHRARRRANVPEHPPLPDDDRSGERPRRDAHAAQGRNHPEHPADAACQARRGRGAEAGAGAARVLGARRRGRRGVRPQSLLRRPAPARGRARARHRAAAAAPRRADGGDEPAGDARVHELRRQAQGGAAADDPHDRARHARGHGDLRPGHSLRLR